MAALQCNFEGGPVETLKIPSLWREYGFNYEQLFHTHAELYSAVFQREKHGKLLKEYLGNSKSCGISTILYLNCHILLESQEKMFGEWAVVNKDGSYKILYDTYKACCLNSSWAEYFFSVIESLKEYDIKGIFFDGPASLTCYCGRCDKKFRGKYGIPIDQGAKDQIEEFVGDTVLDAKKRFYSKVKEVNPEWAAYFNEHLLYSHRSIPYMKETLSYNDIIGTEGGFQFYRPAKEADLWRCGACAKLAEAVSDGKPIVIFMAGDQKVWSWYLHTPAETKLMYVSAIANGASVWYGLHCYTDVLKGETGAAVKDIVNFDRKWNGVYKNTKCNSQIALFHSFETNRIYASKGEKTDLYADGAKTSEKFIGNCTDSFNGAVNMLFRSNFSFDLICELNIDVLPGYSVLVLPTCACLTDDVLDKIKSFVKNGGVLISDSETALYNLDGEKLGNFALAEIFGADFKGAYKKYREHDYFQLSDNFCRDKSCFAEYIPSPLVSVDINVKKSSEILARLCPSLPGRYSGKPEEGIYPFIVRNEYGKGCSYYFAGTFFEMYNRHSLIHHKRILRSIIMENAKLDFELVGAPESVDLTIRENVDTGEIIFHLINYTGGMSRPIDSIVPVTGLKIKTSRKFRNIKALCSETALRQDKNHIEIPVLKDFEVIVAS
jgi:hypothetical protein